MFAASLCLAGSVGKNALGFGLADTGAGVGFDRLDGGEGPFSSSPREEGESQES